VSAPQDDPKLFLRRALAIIWASLTLSIATYALLKPNTTAKDLAFVPTFVASWLDVYYDLRTLFMAIAVSIVPSLLLRNTCFALQRRILLSITVGVLVGGEVAQIWIPTRGFGIPDILYSLAGVATAEAVAMGWQMFGSRKT